MRGPQRLPSLAFLLGLLLGQRGCAQAADFNGLPGTVQIAENSPPGRPVYTFGLQNCIDPNPTVTITSVNPTCTYFNQPSIDSIPAPNEYTIKITLSSTTALDFEVINQYQLNIRATCGGLSIDGQLTVQLADEKEPPQCGAKFASSVGETVQVLENTPPSTTIYNVVTHGFVQQPLTYKITQPTPTTFSIDSQGNVMPPAAGFSYKSGNTNFKLWITVTDADGKTCSGTLTVIVLPVYVINDIKFTPTTKAVTIDENGGPLSTVTSVSASGKNVLYQMTTLTPFFSVAQDTGVIQTTSNLDLEQNPGLTNNILTIKAYDKYNHTNSATITVTVTVQDVNEMPPICTPAVFVIQIPETTPVRQTLEDFTCSDPDFSKTPVTYKIVPNSNSKYNFIMSGSSLQVNSTLTYDSELIASLHFQYSAILEVTDSGTPPLTTTVPIFVTVTPVNQYPPECGKVSAFNINENAPFNTVIGSVNATDKDYKFNNVQYSISGGDGINPPVFYINPRSGDIHLLSSLDFETRKSYNLVVRVVDLNNDIMPDPKNQKTTSCNITINVQDINDNPPICNPPYYQNTICSTLSTTSTIMTLMCTDIDITSVLSYSIVRGNTNNRFNLAGPALLHSAFSYNPKGVTDPTRFELLIQVTDSPAPRFSTTATVIISVVPCPTTVITTTRTTTTLKKAPLIVTGTETYWAPDAWFVAVLTITGALLLLSLALLAWQICSRTSLCVRAPQDATQPLLQNRPDVEGARASQVTETQAPPQEKQDTAPMSPRSRQFDGRTQDPVSGRDYIFNSQTGDRRWI